MKKLFTLFIALSFVTIGFAQIWTEDFDTDADGDGLLFGSFDPGSGLIYYISEVAPSSSKWSPFDASVKWNDGTVTPTPVFSVQSDRFEISNINPKSGVPLGHAKWKSETIDISAYSKVICSIDFSKEAASGFASSDYFLIQVTIGGSTHTILLDDAKLNSGALSETLTTPSLPTGGTDTMNITISSVNSTTNSLFFDNVTVEEASNNTIYEIQYTTNPGDPLEPTYPSPLVGQTVTIEAAVTHIRASLGYYLQETNGDESGVGNADWRGIYVNDPAGSNSVDLGDVVKLSGTVQEEAGKTIITAVTSLVELENQSTFYDADLVVNVLTEAQESVLNKIVYYKVADASGGQGLQIAFKAGIVEDNKPGYDFVIFVDKYLSAFGVPNEPEVLYSSVTGVTNYYANTFRLSPRDLSDFDFTETPVEVENKTIDANRISAISNNIVLESENATDVSIYNLSGQLVKQLNVQAGRTEIEMNAGVYVVKMNTGNDIITEKVLVK